MHAVLVEFIGGLVYDGVALGELPRRGDIKKGILGVGGNTINDIGQKTI